MNEKIKTPEERLFSRREIDGLSEDEYSFGHDSIDLLAGVSSSTFVDSESNQPDTLEEDDVVGRILELMEKLDTKNMSFLFMKCINGNDNFLKCLKEFSATYLESLDVESWRELLQDVDNSTFHHLFLVFVNEVLDRYALVHTHFENSGLVQNIIEAIGSMESGFERSNATLKIISSGVLMLSRQAMMRFK